MRRPPLRTVVARNIRAFARSRSMTINAVADFAEVSRSQMFAVLAGEASPSIDWLAKVAEALEVEAWELLRPGSGKSAPRAAR